MSWAVGGPSGAQAGLATTAAAAAAATTATTMTMMTSKGTEHNMLMMMASKGTEHKCCGDDGCGETPIRSYTDQQAGNTYIMSVEPTGCELIPAWNRNV